MTGRAKWDAWAAAGEKYVSVDRLGEAEARYLEIAKEQGWDGAQVTPAPVSETKTEQPISDEELLSSDDDDDDDRVPRDEKNRSQGGSQGLGMAVSSLFRDEDYKDHSIHGLVIDGDVEGLKSLLAIPGIDVDERDEYVSDCCCMS